MKAIVLHGSSKHGSSTPVKARGSSRFVVPTAILPSAILLPALVSMLVAVFCLFLSTMAGAQTASIPTPPTGAAVVASAASEYVLGPGDQIVFHVVDMEEFPDKPMRIDPNGFIDLPLAGRLQASGLTIAQLKQELGKRLSKYINSPQISINLTEDQSRPISIIGAVNSPGVHQLLGPRHLIEAISLAGGLRADAGPRVILTRQSKWGQLPVANAKKDLVSGSSTAILSLDDLLAAKNPADDILIEPNDVISIPKADVVYVVGSVKKAGGFQLSSHETISLLQALSLAEGTDQDASPRRARILRPTLEDASKVNEIPVDIQKIFEGKAPDMKLYANDVLFVPTSLTRSGVRRTAEAILQAATGVAVYRH